MVVGCLGFVSAHGDSKSSTSIVCGELEGEIIGMMDVWMGG